VKWQKLQADPFFYQPSQLAFLDAKNQRSCTNPDCQDKELTLGYDKGVYLCTPPVTNCPRCDKPGKRRFDRLTIIAGRRFGKSKIGSIAGVEEATIPGSIGWACAPTVPKLHRYVIPAYQQLIPEDWIQSWNAEFLDLRLINGSLIHFQTLEHVDQGRGQGLDWLYIDECCELTKEHWDVIRPSLAGDTVAFFTTTPRGYDWVYEDLFKPAEDAVPGYWACHAKTAQSANPDISAGFLDREKSQMSEMMFRQEYEADFVTFTGAIYGEDLKPRHILNTAEEVQQLIPEWPLINPDRPILMGIDTGADHPFGAVKLVSTPKGLVVVDEYLERERSFSQHALFLRQMGGPKPQYAINKNDKQASLELAQHGVFCMKAENDVVAGTERVKSWLAVNQLYFVAKNCPRTLRQLQAYRWAENTAADGSTRKEKVFKKNDELPDSLRYALMAWPILPKPLEAENTGRDISALPQKMQEDIVEMRRIEAAITNQDKAPPTITGDLWASTIDETY
jgi:hypothetical protein